MKKIKQQTYPLIEQSIGVEKNQDPYEIIYADPRNEEIHLQILEKSKLNAQIARWSLDIEYNRLLWSDGVYKILEIDSKKSGASYESFLDVIHPEDRPIKEEAQKALFDAKKPIEITYRLQMNNGRIKWINEICTADLDQNENPTRFYGIIQDITRYKLSEKKFTQIEENYKALITALPSGIAIYQNRKITFINPSGVNLLGAQEANELIGQPVSKFIHSDSLKNFQKKMNDVAHGNAISTFEEKLIRLNGSDLDVEITPVHIIINETPIVQVIVTDISERKKIEQELKKSEEKYRLLTVNLSDISWTINSEGIITYVSPFEENFIGYEAEKIIKDKLFNFLTTSSVISSLIELKELKAILQSGGKMEPRKLILESISQDGETKWKEITSTAIYDSSNCFIGFSGTCQDITNRKKMEEIIEENLRLHENEFRLKEIIATKDKFLSIIAHDLRSPFNSTIDLLELLKSNYDEFSDSERKENLSLISDNAKTTLNLLENLLLWAKSKTGRIAIQPVKQKLLPLLNSINENLNSAINHKRLSFKIFISDDIEVFADTNMLISIIQNLISNAIKYSRQGGSITIKVQEIQKQIEIKVSDNGVGMSKETVRKLFLVGENISIPGTYNEKGSGLGLILCKEFVEKHNGSIIVKSELGIGTEFIIRIPQNE